MIALVTPGGKESLLNGGLWEQSFMTGLQLVLCTCNLFTLMVIINLAPGLAHESPNRHDNNVYSIEYTGTVWKRCMED